jgi:hypothetical protein
VASVGLFPVYGSGGHGPMTWETLLGVFKGVNDDYGPFTVATVYGAYFLGLAALLLYRKRRRKEAGS